MGDISANFSWNEFHCHDGTPVPAMYEDNVKRLVAEVLQPLRDALGKPVKIIDMARDLIRLSGKDPDREIRIDFTGLREGEKLYEELITEGEDVVPTNHEKIMVLESSNGWNGHGDQLTYRRWLLARVQELRALAENYDACGIKEALKKIVPEYTVQDSECVL